MNETDILNMFCTMVITLVEAAEEDNNGKLTKDDNVTLSFERGGRKYTVCVAVEEEGAKNE